jgi:Fic family protein
MPFTPQFTITPAIAQSLMRIEGVKQRLVGLPITPNVMATLRESARLYSTHYSTMIEGNRLSQEQVTQVVEHREHFPGRERDEHEVLGYYAALEQVESAAARGGLITQIQIQQLHALVMAGGKTRVSPTPYRDGQNVIREARNQRIAYLPPEAHDVPKLMRELVAWINKSQKQHLPCPLRAGIAHYQFATIHPYYDGNGRTARLLTTLILHLGGYDLKGLYSLEEYYARKLHAYYDALTVGPSHNYYFGRAEADVTDWVDYFCRGMADSFEAVQKRAEEVVASADASAWLRKLDPRQRKVLVLFSDSDTITSRDVERLFSISQRTARLLLKQWTEQGLLVIADSAKKSRKYALAPEYRILSNL